MRKALAILIAAVLCAACFVGCAQDKDAASPSADSTADSSAAPSASAEDKASEATSAVASEAASADASETASEDASAVPVAEGDGFDWFFTEWSTRLEQLGATDMTEQPEVSEGLSDLVSQSRDWKNHLTDNTVQLELPSQSVVLDASGTEVKMDSASIQCKMELTNLENGVTPPIYLFTLGAGALVEVLSGEADGGLDTVNETVAALLGGSSEGGIITSKPVAFGNAEFVVSLDADRRILSLTGTPV